MFSRFLLNVRILPLILYVLPFQGNTVSAVALSEESQRIVPEAVSSVRKSEADSMLTSQFSSAETRSNELAVVSPSMISRTVPSDIGAARSIDEDLQATAQGQRVAADTVEVINIDETIGETRNIQEIKATGADEHVAKKLKYMEH